MKQIQDYIVKSNVGCGSGYALLVLTPADGVALPEIAPGQFVQVATDAPGVMLRRPISINKVDREASELWLLIRRAGRGTDHLAALPSGARLNLLLPLGNGFTPARSGERTLLIGGGVGVAPLLQLGRELKDAGVGVEFLLAARSVADILEREEFESVGKVHYSTDDGSLGTPGVATLNPVLDEEFDRWYCCGPAPMMKAVARKAWSRGVDCEVSLENMMACGLGACLCCVEKTVKGNVCVCTEGPVFNINQLTWEH